MNKNYVNNQDISRLLRNMAAAYEILGEDFFRIRAYNTAAEAVDQMTIQVKDIWEKNKLQSIAGIGASIAGHLAEFFEKGSSKHFQEILSKIPASVFELIKLPGVGAKTAVKLAKELKIASSETAINDLLKAASKGKIAQIEGFGEKSQEELVEAIKRYRRLEPQKKRMLLPVATEIADKAIAYMHRCQAVERIEPLGSLRRAVPTIGDIDLAVATNDPAQVINHFKKWPETEKILAAGENTARIINTNGIQIDIKTQDPSRFGSLLQHFTGSKEHNIALREYAQLRGWSLSEYGIKKKDGKIKKFATEEDFYKELGMAWIPPELRENRGEIEMAIKNKLPQLVDKQDIKGDLHIHTSFDTRTSLDIGTDSFNLLVEKGINFGYQFIGFSDHSPAQSLSMKDAHVLIKRRNQQIEQFFRTYKNREKIRIYKLLETDILADGTIPLDEKSIDLLDAIIVSIHSSFRQNKKIMTRRILSGLVHPKAKILGHPTGRLLNEREGVEADWETIFKFCAQNNKAVEINAYPNRLDLPETMVCEASRFNVKFVIGSDAHNAASMENIKYGVSIAKRGWLTKEQVLNAFSLKEFDQWLSEK